MPPLVEGGKVVQLLSILFRLDEALSNVALGLVTGQQTQTHSSRCRCSGQRRPNVHSTGSNANLRAPMAAGLMLTSLAIPCTASCS